MPEIDTNNRKIRVLFICAHNSGRSQMAEVFLNSLKGSKFEAESAGLEPTGINPLVAEVMEESGLDISKNRSDSVFEFFKEGRLYDFVVTVCDDATEKICPIFPGVRRRIHWPFPDPEQVSGTRQEKLNQVRKIRDDIKEKIEQWLDQMI